MQNKKFKAFLALHGVNPNFLKKKKERKTKKKNLHALMYLNQIIH